MSSILRWLVCALVMACSRSGDASQDRLPAPAPAGPHIADASGSPDATVDAETPAAVGIRCDSIPEATSEFSRACFMGDIDTVRVRLVSVSANDRPDPCQLTPFAEALAPRIAEPGTPLVQEERRRARKLKIAYMLLDKGIDVHATDRYGSTALHHAAGAYYPEAEVLRLLRHVLALSPDLNAQTTGGVTALFLAAEKGQTEVVRLLLAAGADPSLASTRGATPISIAKERGHAQVQKLLEERMALRQTNLAQQLQDGGGP